MRVRHTIWAQRADFVPNPPGKHLFAATSQTSMFWGFTKKSSTLPHVVWAGESKTGLGFGIGPRQQTCQRSPNVHLKGNPAVPPYMWFLRRRSSRPSLNLLAGAMESSTAEALRIDTDLSKCPKLNRIYPPTSESTCVSSRRLRPCCLPKALQKFSQYLCLSSEMWAKDVLLSTHAKGS